jgi:hypothetical protein
MDEYVKNVGPYELLRFDKMGYKDAWRLCSLQCVADFVEKRRKELDRKLRDIWWNLGEELPTSENAISRSFQRQLNVARPKVFELSRALYLRIV